MVQKKNNNIGSFISENYIYAIIAFLLFVTIGPLLYALLKNIFGFNEPPRDCRRLNFLREYDNENTKLHS